MGNSLKLSRLGKHGRGNSPLVHAIVVVEGDVDCDRAGATAANRDAQIALDGLPTTLALPTAPIGSNRAEQIGKPVAIRVSVNALGAPKTVALDGRHEVIAAPTVKTQATSVAR